MPTSLPQSTAAYTLVPASAPNAPVRETRVAPPLRSAHAATVPELVPSAQAATRAAVVRGSAKHPAQAPTHAATVPELVRSAQAPTRGAVVRGSAKHHAQAATRGAVVRGSAKHHAQAATRAAVVRGSTKKPAQAPTRGAVVRGSTKHRGSALLTVLWLSAALAAIGISVASTVRTETERTATNVDDTKAYFLARGAIEQAALHVFWGRFYTSDTGQPLYYRPGTPALDLAFPGGEVHVEIIPETAKLNLNSALPQSILRLLEALGLPPDRAIQITSAIVDWRTPRDPLRPSPFDAFYSAQRPTFSARHASFQENEELLLVQGITPDIYYGTSLSGERAGLRDCISVFGTNGGVEINTAQPATLIAAGLSPEDASSIVRLRANHPIIDPTEFYKLVQSLGPSANALVLGGKTIYTLRATARLRQPDGKLSDLRRTAAALVKVTWPAPADPETDTPAKIPGIEVLRWYDRQ